MSSILAPLYRLLQRDKKWSWGKEQQKPFDEVKRLLTSESLLVHYDPSKELLLACDASPYGLGAVLTHHRPNGQEQPVAYASRSLGAAEKNYIFTVGKRGSDYHFRYKKIPSVPIRPMLLYSFRPQTTPAHLQ